MESNRKDIAKNYILYRKERADIRESKWQMDELQKCCGKLKKLDTKSHILYDPIYMIAYTTNS